MFKTTSNKEHHTAPKILFYEYHLTDCFSNPLKNPKAGEPGGYRDIVNELRRNGFEVETLNNKLIYHYKESIDVLVIVYGRDSSNLSQEEIASIIEYVNKSGRLFIIYDSWREGGIDTNLNELLKIWCFQFCNDLVWDAGRVLSSNDGWRKRIIVDDFESEHPITQEVKRVWYWGCSIKILESCIKGKDIKTSILARAGDDSYSATTGVELKKDGKGGYECAFQPTMLNDPPYLPGQKPPVLVCCEEINSGGIVIAYGARYTFNNDSIKLHRFDFDNFGHEKLFFNIFKYLCKNSKKIMITPPNYKAKIELWSSQHRKLMIGLILSIIASIIAGVILGV